MKLSKRSAEIFIPDGTSMPKAVRRTTVMCVAAHHDDIEIMAPRQIIDCFGRRDRWFFGVVATNGAGSPRCNIYAKYTDKQMQAVRRDEQRKAALVGEFGALAMLDHPSRAIKKANNPVVIEDISLLIHMAKPHTVVMHNLADKHDTHVALALRTLEALRSLPSADRPKKVYGGEVWRDLDWMLDDDKVLWDVSSQQNLQASLLGVFDSQISGGKRYDLAAAGRRRAHATYNQSHSVDVTEAMAVGMDLTPLVKNRKLDPFAYVDGLLSRFRDDVKARIERFQ